MSSEEFELSGFCGQAVVLDQVDEFGVGPGFVDEGIEPEWPVLFVVGELALVEDDDGGEVFVGGPSEELFDGGVVVFLLSQDCDQDIGRSSEPFGSIPIHSGIAVDIGRIEDEQVFGHRVTGSPEQQVFWDILEGLFGSGPGCDEESIEYRFESTRVERFGDQAQRVSGSGGEWAGGTDGVAGDVVEHHAFARVGAPDDGGDQWSVGVELRQQFSDEQFVPRFAIGARQSEAVELLSERLEVATQLLERVGTIGQRVSHSSGPGAGLVIGWGWEVECGL